MDIDADGSDYINASFIDVSLEKKIYCDRMFLTRAASTIEFMRCICKEIDYLSNIGRTYGACSFMKLVENRRQIYPTNSAIDALITLPTIYIKMINLKGSFY